MRPWLVLDAALALAAVAALTWAGIDEGSEPWREHQRRYQDLVRREGSDAAKQALRGETIRPHEISRPEIGLVDRCTTCHLGMEPGAAAFEEIELFRAHPGTWLESHPVDRFGCTSCHGGQGRSLDPARAHDRRHGGGPNAFTPPAVRCARCHPAGGLEGAEQVSRGVGLYFEHSCSGCHQPGRPGPGIGPDLSAIGLRGGAYLRQAVLSPDVIYPQTIMPPLRYKLPAKGPEIDALVAYLRTLEPWPVGVTGAPRQPRRFDSRQCAGCHRVAGPEAMEHPMGPGHKCTYLHEQAAWLRCDRCHGAREVEVRVPSEVPAGTKAGQAPGSTALAERFRSELGRAARRVEARDPSGRCPHLEEATSACGVCHREGER